MIAEPSKLSVEDFVDLLHQLDAFIGSKNPEFQLDIKAIGGFSMMYHEKETSLKMLRKGSSDIDTLTMLPKQVATMVDIIATNNGVSPDWLNNRWFADNEYHEELEPYIVWKDSGFKFYHINLKIADLEGLFLLKARSVCDAIEFSGYPNDKGKLQNELRTQDVMDLISILRFFGESDLENLQHLARRTDLPGYDLLAQYFRESGVLDEG